MELFALVLLMLFILAYVGWPLTQARYRYSFIPGEILNQELERLEKTKRELLLALKEIEFEYQLGKISPADYEKLEKEYKFQTVQVLKQIDQIGDDHKAQNQNKNLEALVAAFRKKKGKNADSGGRNKEQAGQSGTEEQQNN